ncbi:uncharacterized protein PRCAT00001431001 [Priceomyces carsonii]|uniref:uncharacterized protein n=1 Tax=Priceomyces carsonii TaxID=28549 RepID=UPI002ED91FCE|nr:unnamed protein product [Priceomyces carsonii]
MRTQKENKITKTKNNTFHSRSNNVNTESNSTAHNYFNAFAGESKKRRQDIAFSFIPLISNFAIAGVGEDSDILKRVLFVKKTVLYICIAGYKTVHSRIRVEVAFTEKIFKNHIS